MQQERGSHTAGRCTMGVKTGAYIKGGNPHVPWASVKRIPEVRGGPERN